MNSAAASTSKRQHENQQDGPDPLLVHKINCPEKPDDGHWKTKEDGRELRRIFVWVDGAAGDLDLIEMVVYTLDPSFKEPVREITDRANGFELRTNGWGEFEIKAVAHFRDGRPAKALATDITFQPLESPAEQKPHVSVSGNYFTNPTATINQAPLRERSFEVVVGDASNDRTVRLAPGDTAPKDAPFAPEMVLVRPGKFWMGSKDGEGEDSERPRHEVTISYPLLVGKYPVTFDEWDAFDRAGGIVETKETSTGLIFKKSETTREKYAPADQGWGRGRRPVINVSWHDVQAYAKWLSQQTGKTYRLLSEAE